MKVNQYICLHNASNFQMEAQNKKVLVTGGGSGIGLAISKALVAKGATVTICGRSASKLAKAQELNPELRTAVCDVTSDEAIQNLMKELEGSGGIDILINNAGVFESVNYANETVSISKQEREVAIDFMGPIRMVNHFLPMLRARSESAIVNVSSGLAFVPFVLAPVYSGTKAGLHAWTRSLRYQLEETNIKVFELMPPLVKTDMVSSLGEQKTMDPDVLADSFLSGFKKNQYEITPGQSSQLRMMSRVAPGFIFKALNKQFS